jgi:hypothetical protein
VVLSDILDLLSLCHGSCAASNPVENITIVTIPKLQVHLEERMRASLSLIAVMVGFVGASMASPLTPTSPFTKRHPPGPKDPKGPKHGPPGPGGMIAAIGPCTVSFGFITLRVGEN